MFSVLQSNPNSERPAGVPSRSRIALRFVVVLLVLPWMLASIVGLSASPAGAAEKGATASTIVPPYRPDPATMPELTTDEALARTENFLDVIEVNGWIDAVQRDYIVDSIELAVKKNAQALVVQLDSPGSLLPADELDALVAKVAGEKRVPIAVWVGDLRARAKGGAARIAAAADILGVAGQTRVGGIEATDGAALSGPQTALVGATLGREELLRQKIALIDAPVLVEFVGQLHGRVLDGRPLVTVYRETVDGEEVRKPFGIRFAKLGLLRNLMHIATSPSIAYLFLLVALSLFVFEFYTGGIGVAAVVGLMAFVLAATGLGSLPTRPIGLALIVLAMIGFSIDIQAGAPRFWTAVAVIALVVGSVLLFSNGVRIPLLWIAIMTVMVVLFMVNGMPTMVRTRFATPTIGREDMVGDIGNARDAIAPEGVVMLRGAPWRARTNRATPIEAGSPVRVVAIDGLLLEVEPLEGAAKDHRDRSH